MDKELHDAIIKIYGMQCEKCMEEINKRITIMIAALLYTGNTGSSKLCELNRAFESI